MWAHLFLATVQAHILIPIFQNWKLNFLEIKPLPKSHSYEVAEPGMGPRSKACDPPTFLYRPSGGKLYLECLVQKWHPRPVILNVLCIVIQPSPGLDPASLFTPTTNGGPQSRALSEEGLKDPGASKWQQGTDSAGSGYLQGLGTGPSKGWEPDTFDEGTNRKLSA